MQFEAVMIIQPALATLFVFVFFIRKYISKFACIKVMKTKFYTFDFGPSKLGAYLIEQGS